MCDEVINDLCEKLIAGFPIKLIKYYFIILHNQRSKFRPPFTKTGYAITKEQVFQIRLV